MWQYTFYPLLFYFSTRTYYFLMPATTLSRKVDLKDMQTLNAIEKKPFFASYKKANASLVGDMSTFLDKVVAGMRK